jgi:hypothetical protein
VHHVIRFFVVDVNISDIQDMGSVCGNIFYVYLGTALIILAPVITFSVILSFWQNFDTYRKLVGHPCAPIYVFSELNEKSLALATDIKGNNKKSIVIFTDVFEPDNEESYDLLESAKELGALCFKKDMLSLNLRFHSKHSPIYFFAIAEARSVRGIYREMLSSITPDEENLKQARFIMADKFYSRRHNTFIFVFSSSTMGKLLYDSLPPSSVMPRRVNRYSSFIRRTLYSHGKEMLFDTALDVGTDEKEINAIIIGAGGYGSEMFKSLPWYCQMDGYRLNLHVFDASPNTSDRFSFECPSLMGENNGNFDSFEIPRYKITFYDGTEVSTNSFAEKLLSIKWPTYILVALGSDELNINTAVEIRRLFRRARCPFDPRIDAIIYNSENTAILDNATKRGTPYKINCIGNLRETFSEKTIIKDDFEREITKLHVKWGGGRMDDDSVNSTEAYLIHVDLREKLGIDQYEFSSSNRENMGKLSLLEHRRWLAYMFSEGYVPTTDTGRDTIAKTHTDLVPYSRLSNRWASKERIPESTKK